MTIARERVISVLLADDDPTVLAALTDLIGDDPALVVVATAADAAGAIEAALRERPDVAVLDVSMPGGGVQAAGEIRRLCPQTWVIAFSSSGDPHTVEAMLKAGAARFVLKGDPRADLLGTIDEVTAGY